MFISIRVWGFFFKNCPLYLISSAWSDTKCDYFSFLALMKYNVYIYIIIKL